MPLQQASPGCGAEVLAESEAGVVPGTVDAFLKALCRTYGAYGIAAVARDMVVGQVPFWTALPLVWKRSAGSPIPTAERRASDHKSERGLRVEG